MSLPTMRAYGQFVAAGAPIAVNLDMGFVPDYFYAQAESAAAGIIEAQWFNTDNAGLGYCNLYSSTGAITRLAGTGITIWQPAGSGAIPSRWGASTAYSVGQIVRPVSMQSGGVSTNLIGGSPVIQNLPLFQCTTAGTTGAAEPTWPTVYGNTVVDGGVIWTAIDSETWATSGVTAASKMLTGLSGTNSSGVLVTPAPTGLGLTIPAICQSAGIAYDWYAEGRVPSP